MDGVHKNEDMVIIIRISLFSITTNNAILVAFISFYDYAKGIVI